MCIGTFIHSETLLAAAATTLPTVLYHVVVGPHKHFLQECLSKALSEPLLLMRGVRPSTDEDENSTFTPHNTYVVQLAVYV